MPANRLLALAGTDVKLVDTVAVGDGVSQVAFTPGGKRALATKFSANKLPLFAVDGDKVSPAKLDLPTGPSPHNVAVPPDGSIALTADNGGGGSSDGRHRQRRRSSSRAPRIIDRVVVGDGPEGPAISLKGDLAIAALLSGSNNHRNGLVTVLAINGKTVRRHHGRGLARGRVFTPDGARPGFLHPARRA